MAASEAFTESFLIRAKPANELDAMARFYPLYVRRSDGKLEIIVKGRLKEVNQPTEDQLDQKPDKDGVSDYYREVSLDEPKHLDWRRKLGGMLARELEAKDKPASNSEYGHILVAFPEGYRLYEHVKRTEKDGRLEIKSKAHAAGGNDRQDAYLYGYPAGRKKRFRSPADFFPHLLWLCTDESGDPDNCSCKFCCPTELESLVPNARVAVEKPVKQEAETKQLIDVPTVQSTLASSARTAEKPVSETQARAPPTTPLSQPLVPSALPRPKTQEQFVDSQYHSFLFRSGELVWFQRGPTWGLGVILRRWMSAANHPHYNVQPLSYPVNHPPAVVKESDREMRPWLAWSVPKYTHDGLNALAELPRYQTVNWQGIANKQYGNGDLEVDASILAAKFIDSCFTLLHKTTSTEVSPGVIETYYDGVYLGAEKIWLGDPVRLQIGSGTDIMVVHSIVERRRVFAMNQQAVQLSYHFGGDVYAISTVPHSNPNIPTPAAQNNNPQLPQRLTEDLAYRNARSIPIREQASYWRLASANVRVDFSDIKGRWYEASRLMPILQPAEFEDSARKGDIQEATLWMNSRGDCINKNRESMPRLPRENIRKETRREALGNAVPRDTNIYDGLDPPRVDPALEAPGQHTNEMNIDPRFETAQDADGLQPDQSSLPLDPAVGLDEFMNLDSNQELSQLSGFDNHEGFY